MYEITGQENTNLACVDSVFRELRVDTSTQISKVKTLLGFNTTFNEDNGNWEKFITRFIWDEF